MKVVRIKKWNFFVEIWGIVGDNFGAVAVMVRRTIRISRVGTDNMKTFLIFDCRRSLHPILRSAGVSPTASPEVCTELEVVTDNNGYWEGTRGVGNLGFLICDLRFNAEREVLMDDKQQARGARHGTE
jgi:hypothetical protein